MNQQQLTAVQTREQYYTDELTRLNERVAELEQQLDEARSVPLDVAQWCLKQVDHIDNGMIIDPTSDFWNGNKIAYQQVAIELSERAAALEGR